MQVCAAEWLSQLTRQMEEEVFVFSIFMLVVLFFVIVLVFDSIASVATFWFQEFLCIQLQLNFTNQKINFLPPARPYRGVGN